MGVLAALPRRRLGPLELALVGLLLTPLVLLLIGRVNAMLAHAERAAMALTLQNLESALRFEAAWQLSQGHHAAVAALDGSDPFALMDLMRARELPIGEPAYLGAVGAADVAQVRGGQWYFDPKRRILMYRVRHARYFGGGLDGPAQAGFRVTLAYEDRNSNGRYDDGDRLQGIRLQAVAPYRWELAGN